LLPWKYTSSRATATKFSNDSLDLETLRDNLRLLSTSVYVLDRLFKSPEEIISKNIENTKVDEYDGARKLSTFKYFFNLGRYLLNISEKEKTESFLRQLHTSIAMVDTSTISEGDLPKLLFNDETQSSMVFEDHGAIIEDYLNLTRKYHKGIVVSKKDQPFSNQLLWADIANQEFWENNVYAIINNLNACVFYNAICKEISILEGKYYEFFIRIGEYYLSAKRGSKDTVYTLFDKDKIVRANLVLSAISKPSKVFFIDHSNLRVCLGRRLELANSGQNTIMLKIFNKPKTKIKKIHDETCDKAKYSSFIYCNNSKIEVLAHFREQKSKYQIIKVGKESEDAGISWSLFVDIYNFTARHQILKEQMMKEICGAHGDIVAAMNARYLLIARPTPLVYLFDLHKKFHLGV
jgi:hypothetical protein